MSCIHTAVTGEQIELAIKEQDEEQLMEVSGQY